ncbi:MAG: lipopolysaccharide core heptose(I) kinase RfaP [Verrucomicrobiota bacterium]|nr:lipopolysaccharide core heptose(I) kinase RfaP [Verrucomicrobiota bacterium]
MWINLDPELARYYSEESAFDQLMNCEGEKFRHIKTRRTIKFEKGGKNYFIKIHRACGWREVWKNWFAFKRPVTSARMEWEAIDRLNSLNVSTLSVVGRGIRGKAPANQESFVITEALEGMISLEQLTQRWKELAVCKRICLKRELIRQVAIIAKTIHCNGLNHRDFYLCHFLVKDRQWDQWQPEDFLTLHLIDLHRMQQRLIVPKRWWIKDLAGLLFSALDCNLTRNDLLRFSMIYWDCSLHDLCRERLSILWKIYRKARRLYTSIHDKDAPKLAGFI